MSTSSATVFGYFVSLSTVLGLINWVNIIVTYFCFQRGLKAQGYQRADLPWRGPLQPYGTYVAFCITAIVIVFQGYAAFIPHFVTAKFVVAYIGIVAYLVNIFGFKIFRRTRRVAGRDVDLVTGTRQQQAEELDEGKRKKGVVARAKGLLWGN